VPAISQPELGWRKSRACHREECVEVAGGEDRILVRVLRAGNGHVLEFSHHDWRVFLENVRQIR